MTDLTCPECGPKWHGAYTCDHRCVKCGSVLHADDSQPTENEVRELADRWKDRCEATREYVEVLREKNASLEANLISLEQTYEALSKDCREYRDEAEALAAHVERLRSQMDQVMPSKDMSSDLGEIYKLYDEFEATPKTNLAQRDARVAAGAMEEVARWLDGGVDDHSGMEIGCEISGPTRCSSADKCRTAGARAFREAARIWRIKSEEYASKPGGGDDE